MVKVFQEMCDGCGLLLQGMQGTAHIKKDALHITGSISRREVDPQTKWGEYTFITPKKDSELTFCWDTIHDSIDTVCLMSYIENNFKMRKEHFENVKKRKAMEEKTGIVQDDRSDYEIMKDSRGPTDKFGIGHKDY